jgi:hypothetical protein
MSRHFKVLSEELRERRRAHLLSTSASSSSACSGSRDGGPNHHDANGTASNRPHSGVPTSSESGRCPIGVEIRLLEDDDMRLLAERLRPMDLLEVRSAVPEGPLDEVLVEVGRTSFRGRAGYFEGELVACWAISPHNGSGTEVAPWLLATDAIDRPEVRRAFLAHGRDELRKLTEDVEYLWNYVHRDNTVARRWLRFMGFEFRDRRQYVMSGEHFVRFEMRAL